ncbi:lysophospholipid acyltransferase family protein [Lutimaribacter sp. EGI FJ00015]|uniref:Lysophospholipid acyltransferase family protein n=1 Tax=Lutimaribacter degradans TaxID=2945989 RepID=A0ACC5ZYP1_9RHOB|nr:lysophospholipid acyltransferase family protein [Lutimaribacter sp. EGI FJ00013]MCM2563467.1 lysophospholipid acyltransferase family protein [Lutimaribacter sp. EGI FJ00013]MCO0614647.1 lysophospholipid acyltransferase family protein [Lutimaribacter sp. EGI FJ00015]MCO0637318.1 lysophospholipid acyltransferase family protein [Lutimaribacter sp. EGI FJ00014]
MPRGTDDVVYTKYDRRSLTYANSFDSPMTATIIRAMEWMTGKLTIIRRIREFERRGAPRGQAFWPATMDVMGIDLLTPDEQLARIPKTGPVVFVANHPHGLVDGMILADLIGRVRDDYRILTRSLLTGIDESAASYMIPVPFPHQPDAQEEMIRMRSQAMDHLAQGGLVALFPSGVVAASKTMFGPVIEAEWNVFTAKMIRRSGATVVPCFFPGSNSRWYQVANRISPVLRQGLLLHEVVHSFDKPQTPVIGHPISPEECAERGRDPRAFMAWLREHTLGLRD